jgi:hypothetical protein
MIRPRLSRSAAIGLALAALAAPAASAAPLQDLRSPDTRDAGMVAAVQPQPSRQDFRSPDVRDHADGRGTFNAPEVTVVKVPATATPEKAPSASALDWSDVAIGAGAALGVMLLAIGGSLAVRQSVTSRIA